MKKIIYTLILLMIGGTLFAQDDTKEDKYRRSSIYSILISKPDTKFGKEIESVYLTIPVPEKYNDHNLSVRVISSTEKREVEPNITTFLKKNCVARRMVGRWFDRDPKRGDCSLDVIYNRGMYDATYYDLKVSEMSVRGHAMLADAGEELIANSFVLVNDIRYVDKAQNAQVWGALAKGLGSVAAAYTGNSSFQDLGNSVGALVEQIKGFRVTVDSYLYRLEWNDSVSTKFYTDYYIPYKETDEAKRLAFNNDKSTFKLAYIGKQSVDSGQTSIEGINTETPEHMIRKVCTRAIDESIVGLQSNYEVFRIKTPIHSITPNITAMVGMKEGVNQNVKFEVLEKLIDKNGKTQYKRVGIIQPVAGKIWDNRYMAVEEKTIGATLGATTFRKVSGGDFYPGMLIRQIK